MGARNCSRVGALVLLLVAQPIGAQVVVAPGSPEISPPQRVEGATSMELIRVTEAGESTTARVTRTYAMTDWNGQPAFLFVQQYATPDGTPTDADSSWIRASDLRPLAYHASVGPERQVVVFTPGGAKATFTTPGTTRTVSHEEAAGAFNAVAEDLVIGSLPLSPGYEAQLPFYNPGRGAANVAIQVEELDTLATGDGTMEAWRVRYETQVTSWFWFDPETGRLLRSRTALPNGSEFWRVRTSDVEAWRGARAPDGA